MGWLQLAVFAAIHGITDPAARLASFDASERLDGQARDARNGRPSNTSKVASTRPLAPSEVEAGASQSFRSCRQRSLGIESGSFVNGPDWLLRYRAVGRNRDQRFKVIVKRNDFEAECAPWVLIAVMVSV